MIAAKRKCEYSTRFYDKRTRHAAAAYRQLSGYCKRMVPRKSGRKQTRIPYKLSCDPRSYINIIIITVICVKPRRYRLFCFFRPRRTEKTITTLEKQTHPPLLHKFT